MRANISQWEGRVQRVENNGPAIEYVTAGEPGRQAIVFVHSLLASWKQFLPQLEYFQKHFFVTALSLRGHGGSGRPETETPETYGLESFSRDVLRVCDHLGLEKFHYVGNSVGGLTGYAFLDQYPDRLKSLTTFGSPGDLDFPPWLVRGYGRLMSLCVRLLGDRLYGKVASRMAVCTPEAYSFLVKEVAGDVNWQVVRHVFANIGRLSYGNLLETSRVPILVIHADKDYGFQRLLKSTFQAAEKNPRLVIKPLANAGHLANLDQPAELNLLVEQHLKAHA